MKRGIYSFIVSHQMGDVHRSSAPSELYAYLLMTAGCDEWLAGKVYQWATTATPGEIFNGKIFSEGKDQMVFTVRCDEIILDLHRKDSVFRFQ